MKYFLSLLLFFSLSYSSSEFEDIKQQYSKSYDYEQMQKYDEAIKVLSPLYAKYPNEYTPNLRFGWLFYLAGKYQDSIFYYKKATLSNPNSIEARIGLARTYLQASQPRDAENTCEHILKIDYYSYYGNFYIVKALIAQKKYDMATQMIQKMLAIYPTDIIYLEQLATVYKLTKSQYLQQLYEDILTLDPYNILVRTNLI